MRRSDDDVRWIGGIDSDLPRRGKAAVCDRSLSGSENCETHGGAEQASPIGRVEPGSMLEWGVLRG